jgi:glutathione S-transferase
LRDFPFVIAKKPTIADISMIGYLMFPKYEAGFDFAVSHPSIAAWLDGVSALPGWRPPYDLLPGKRLQCYSAR